MGSGIFNDEASLVRRQPKTVPVEELTPAASGNIVLRIQGLQGNFVFLCLSLQMLLEVLVVREGVVIQVVCEAQRNVQCMKLEAPLVEAQPLPTRVDSFSAQHMVRCQEEPRCQETKEVLVVSPPVP